MELTKKERVIKYTVYAAVIAVAAMLQNVLASHFTVGGARCFILIPVAVLAGINEDEKTASLFGLFGGVLLDMVSAQTRIFSAVFLMLACYASSALVTFIFRSTFLYNMISAVLASILYCVLYWLIFVLIGGESGQGYVLLRFYLPSAIYTAVLSPFVYLLLRPLGEKLNKIEKIES